MPPWSGRIPLTQLNPQSWFGGHFTDIPYALHGISSTVSKSRLRDLRQTFQILESVNLWVLASDEWACACLENEASFFEQTLEVGLHFPIPLFVRQLLTYLCLAPGHIMPNGWRILIECMVLWLACSDGQDHMTILEFLYCYKVV